MPLGLVKNSLGLQWHQALGVGSGLQKHYLTKRAIMIALLLALNLANHSPYHWTMTCARWQEARIKIMMDPNLDYRSKLQVINYLRSKVQEKCDSVLI
jgi:hypothetical protein